MKSISRTIEKTTIEADAVKFVNNVWEHRGLTSVTTSEKVEDTKEAKFFKDQLQTGETLLIKSKETIEKVFSVPTDAFIKYAEEFEKSAREVLKEASMKLDQAIAKAEQDELNIQEDIKLNEERGNK